MRNEAPGAIQVLLFSSAPARERLNRGGANLTLPRGEVLRGYAPGLPNKPDKALRNAASFLIP